MNEDSKQVVGCLLICLVLCFPVFGIGSCALNGCGRNYSTGERSGVVWKFSNKGLIWKSWEGEMNLGGMSVGEGGVVVPNRWSFSCLDEAVAKTIADAQRSGKRVTLHYRQWFMGPIKIETGYEIESVVIED